jgi:hypothetical protein
MNTLSNKMCQDQKKKKKKRRARGEKKEQPKSEKHRELMKGMTSRETSGLIGPSPGGEEDSAINGSRICLPYLFSSNYIPSRLYTD